MIRISLKEDSLDSIADKEHSALRRRFLKDAGKHYRKDAWSLDGGYAKLQACMGAGLGAAGTGGAFLLDYLEISPFASVVSLMFGAAGAVNVGWAFWRRRKARKLVMEALEYKSSGMDHDELERRIADRDYDLPEPTEEERQNSVMDAYTAMVVNAVAEKEHKMVKHPWTIAGFCIMGAGLYTMQSSSQVGGGMAMTLGGMMTIASQYRRSRKLKKVAEDVRSFLHARGYGFFRDYANRKDPYGFYRRHILDATPAGSD